jgi:hypothetical protein
VNPALPSTTTEKRNNKDAGFEVGEQSNREKDAKNKVFYAFIFGNLIAIRY